MSGFSGATEGGVLHGYDVVNNLTSTETQKPGSANMLRVLNNAIKNTGVPITQGAKIGSFVSKCYVQSNVVLLSGYMNLSAALQTNDVIVTLTGISAVANTIRIPFFNNDGSGKMFFAKIAQNGNQILVDGTPNNTASGQYYVFNFSFPATIGSAS